MKFIKVLIIFLFLISFYERDAFALQIISPKEGQVVFQGDRLTVIVKPDAGEDWKEVLLTIFPMSYNVLTGDYREDIEIPSDSTGTIDFNVYAYSSTGEKVKLTRNLFVKMPPDVVLQGIVVGEDLMVLYIAPPNSSLEDKQRIETDEVSVAGLYSDAVKRKLMSSTSGTTYSSSNETIVTVDSEGKMTAQGIGRAKITVKNGNFSATVDVIVKPYKK